MKGEKFLAFSMAVFRFVSMPVRMDELMLAPNSSGGFRKKRGDSLAFSGTEDTIFFCVLH